jgi:phospholipid transport system substrate-binding protein
MGTRFLSVIHPAIPRMLLRKAVAFAAGVGLSMLSYSVHAAPSSGGDTVQGLYEALVSTMKNGRILGPSGRFAQLQPVIRRSFDIAAMARLSVGPAWAGLSEVQRAQLTDSFGRYISATYADRFDSYAGQKLEVTGEQPAPSGVMVKSQIIKASGEPVKVDYMMRRNGDSWLISDIYLDGAITQTGNDDGGSRATHCRSGDDPGNPGRRNDVQWFFSDRFLLRLFRELPSSGRHEDSPQLPAGPDMDGVGRIDRLVQGARLDIDGVGRSGALMPQARAAICAIGAVEPAAAIGAAGPEFRRTAGHPQPGPRYLEGHAERRSRLLLTLAAMADVKGQGITVAGKSHLAALATAGSHHTPPRFCSKHLRLCNPAQYAGRRGGRGAAGVSPAAPRWSPLKRLRRDGATHGGGVARSASAHSPSAAVPATG